MENKQLTREEAIRNYKKQERKYSFLCGVAYGGMCMYGITMIATNVIINYLAYSHEEAREAIERVFGTGIVTVQGVQGIATIAGMAALGLLAASLARKHDGAKKRRQELEEKLIE